ncbi:hypothetical protein IAQ61_010449 [Plenodomus lingam]|uniref:uncharacterized protein n=1 Tax=Leptosphaeria maculans TaxID=5022 RepID=UPI00332B37C9|nr:hypothetical protein IAQ61_010449 [Plenodomus lingam]
MSILAVHTSFSSIYIPSAMLFLERRDRLHDTTQYHTFAHPFPSTPSQPRSRHEQARCNIDFVGSWGRHSASVSHFHPPIASLASAPTLVQLHTTPNRPRSPQHPPPFYRNIARQPLKLNRTSSTAAPNAHCLRFYIVL